jgi:murein DD-endopeptidase MepM/ murein hydrolase activator NlpD
MARLVRALAVAAQSVPALNSWFNAKEGTLRQHSRVDVGIAIDSADGLFVANLRGAEKLDAWQVRGELNRIRDGVKSRSLPPEDLRDYTLISVAITEAKSRHETLKKLLSSLQGGDTASAIVLNGANATMLIDSTIEEGDPRQSRPEWSGGVERDGAFRAPTDKLIGEQALLLDSFEEEAVVRSETARGVIRLTGVPASRVLEQSGMGGPLIPVSFSANGVPLESIADPFERRIYEVEARLYEAQLYEKALRSLPLGIPVKGAYRETSGFGYRTDPFGRGTAFHEGTDLAAPTGSPLVAAAPGKIIYAAVKGSYGRAVEIDHGGGFRTLYGHMNSISVKVGDTVALGQKVGTMGSTGRSTGPHLHYEVYFRGKSYDPIKFLRAGQHVY